MEVSCRKLSISAETPSLALVHNNDIRTYATINFNSYNLVMDKENPLSANEFIKVNYAYGEISIKNNNMAVLSVNNQVILYTLDLLDSKVMNEKRKQMLLVFD